MKNQTFLIVLLFSILATLSGCEIIGGIFKAGMGVGIFIVVIVIAILVFIISKMRSNK
jgi:hypothetical protein